MSEEFIKKAYSEMQHFYSLWEKKERPRLSPSTDQLFQEPSLVERLGGFRDDEWKAYIHARDLYFSIINRGEPH